MKSEATISFPRTQYQIILRNIEPYKKMALTSHPIFDFSYSVWRQPLKNVPILKIDVPNNLYLIYNDNSLILIQKTFQIISRVQFYEYENLD